MIPIPFLTSIVEVEVNVATPVTSRSPVLMLAREAPIAVISAPTFAPSTISAPSILTLPRMSTIRFSFGVNVVVPIPIAEVVSPKETLISSLKVERPTTLKS